MIFEAFFPFCLAVIFVDDVLIFGAQLPNESSLRISMNKVRDIEGMNMIYDNPDKALEYLRSATVTFLSDFMVDYDDLNTLRIEIIDISDKELLRISQIRKEHVNTLIKLCCYVMGATPVTPQILEAAYTCKRCGHTMFLPQESGRLVEPFECESDVCSRKGPFKLDERQSKQQDFQVLRFQERQEDILGGEKPQAMRAEVTNNQCGKTLPGSRVTVAAIVRERLKIKSTGPTNQFDIILEVVSIMPDETESRITYTKDDVWRLEKYIETNQDYGEWLVSSFAPSIYGHRDVKEALLLQMVSNGYSRNKIDGAVIRDFIHVALVGDPGVSKSSLKAAMKGYDPGIVLSSGTGASVAGLTEAVVKDELTEGYTFEAGVLPLADGRGAVLDEFDKLIQADMKHLNDALDECKFTVHKASIHMELWSRCWMTAMLNPVDGKLNSYDPWYKQVGIPPDTRSRFDLVFIMPDIREEVKDSKVGFAMLNARGIPHSGSNGNSPGSHQNLMKVDDLQKLIAHAKTINPTMSHEVGDAVHRQWMRGRRLSSADRISITSRYMGALVRLARSEAQVHLSSIVTLYHLKRAVRLLESSLMQASLDKDGRMDSGNIATGVPIDMRTVIQTIRHVIETCQKEGGAASIGDIALAVSSYGITRDELDRHLAHLKGRSDIYEPSADRWRVAN